MDFSYKMHLLQAMNQVLRCDTCELNPLYVKIACLRPNLQRSGTTHIQDSLSSSPKDLARPISVQITVKGLV